MHLSILAEVTGTDLKWKWLFVTTVVSQGSVATRLRCGGQCDSHFVANFLTNSTVKKFRKSVNICQSYEQKYRGPFFWLTVYLYFDNNVTVKSVKKLTRCDATAADQLVMIPQWISKVKMSVIWICVSDICDQHAPSKASSRQRHSEAQTYTPSDIQPV